MSLTLNKWRWQEVTITIKEASCQSGCSVVLVAKYCKRCTDSRNNVPVGLGHGISSDQNIFLENLVSHVSLVFSIGLCADPTLRTWTLCQLKN